MADAEFCDVLIVGAGPAGLFLANSLARLNVNFKNIDKRYVILRTYPFLFNIRLFFCTGRLAKLMVTQMVFNLALWKSGRVMACVNALWLWASRSILS